MAGVPFAVMEGMQLLEAGAKEVLPAAVNWVGDKIQKRVNRARRRRRLNNLSKNERAKIGAKIKKGGQSVAKRLSTNKLAKVIRTPSRSMVPKTGVRVVRT